MVDYGKALSRGLKFGFHPRRWLPFFVLDVIFFALMLIVVTGNLSSIIAALLALSTSPVAAASLIGYIAIFFIIFIIWMLVRFWVIGAVIHQAYKEKEFDKSWRISCRKYPSILVAMIIVAIISGIVGAVPYIGWIFSIIVGLVFFFVLQGVVISNFGFYKALTNSWEIFKKRPLSVFVMWLAITIISLIILFIFALPILAVFLNTIFANMVNLTAATPDFSSVLLAFLANLPMFVVGAIILLIGMAIANAFVLKAQTEFYLQVKKKRS